MTSLMEREPATLRRDGTHQPGALDHLELLRRRVETVTRADYLESCVRPYLAVDAAARDQWRTRVIQLDGTGAATVEITFNGVRAFAKLYPDDSGPVIYEKLKAERLAGGDRGGRARPEPPPVPADPRRRQRGGRSP